MATQRMLLMAFCLVTGVAAAGELPHLAGVYRAAKGVQAAVSSPGASGGPLVEVEVQSLAMEILMAEDVARTPSERKALASYKAALVLYQESTELFRAGEQWQTKARVTEGERVVRWPIVIDQSCGSLANQGGVFAELCVKWDSAKGVPAALKLEAERRRAEANLAAVQRELYEKTTLPRMSAINRKLYANDMYWADVEKRLEDQIFVLEMQNRTEKFDFEQRLLAANLHKLIVDSMFLEASAKMSLAKVRRGDALKKAQEADALYLAKPTAKPPAAPFKK